MQEPNVLIVGLGGLGCPLVLAFAERGGASLVLADDDQVDASNLHRQILFRETDVGRPKGDVAKERVLVRAPNLSVKTRGRVLPENVAASLGSVDVVIDGSDNLATKFMLADACVLEGVPLVVAACVGWTGTVFAALAHGKPCYRCLFEDLPYSEAPNCAEVGILGPVAGVIAAVAMDLALALARRDDVGGTLVRFDGRTDRLRTVRVEARADCALCGTAQIRSIERARYTAESPRGGI